MDKRDIAISVLSILLILTVASSFITYHYQQCIIKHLLASNADSSQLQHTTTTGTGTGTQPHISSEHIATANIVAVRSDTRKGVLGKVRVEVKEGSGRVLVSTNPFIEPDTQESARTAVEVAASYTHSDISSYDFIISFDINGTLIGGPSAGAAITAATIAALDGRKVREDVAITGTIERDGSIGRIGAVYEKALAAERNGMSLFLVPDGQSEVVFWERKEVERHIGPFTFINVYYEPRRIDLKEYMKGKMDVKEVSTIYDVVKYMIV